MRGYPSFAFLAVIVSLSGDAVGERERDQLLIYPSQLTSVS